MKAEIAETAARRGGGPSGGAGDREVQKAPLHVRVEFVLRRNCGCWVHDDFCPECWASAEAWMADGDGDEFVRTGLVIHHEGWALTDRERIAVDELLDAEFARRLKEEAA